MRDMSITVYGCEEDEEQAFHSISSSFGVSPVITGSALSESNAKLSLGSQCISVGHKSKVTRPIIAALKNVGVKYISTRSIGLDHIDIKAAEEMGISVGNVAYSPGSVADYTVMLMLMMIRNAKSIVSSIEKNDFRLDSTRGKDLNDMTVGVIGTGHIGKAVINRLHGFGCRVLAWSRCKSCAVNYVTLDELLQKSDIVTIHVSLNKDTYHLIGQEQIETMKQGAFVVNTARGEILDTDVLIKALQNKKLSGAALDVLEGEEGIFYSDYTHKPINHAFLPKLRKMPNVIITPHTAYYTEQALRDTIEKTILNCLNFERGNQYEKIKNCNFVRGLFR